MAFSLLLSSTPLSPSPSPPPPPLPPLSRLSSFQFPLSSFQVLGTPYPLPLPCSQYSKPRKFIPKFAALASQGTNPHPQDDPEDDNEAQFDISRLEEYTEKVPTEVLRVHAVVDGEDDQVLIFKGYSSSLMRATAFDPAEPVLPASATIRAIDRIRGPYNPARVLLIKGGRGLSWQQFQTLLQERGL